LHGQIARALEERFRDAMEGRPETLPHHFTEAGLFKKAVGYWCRAGRQSVAKSGFVEAITQLRTGLRLIADLPDTRERKQRELEIQIAVAGALSVVGTVNLGRHALAPIALAATCNARIASANEISYSEDLSDFGHPNIAGEFNFSLPKFNPAHGVLSDVAISFSSSSASGASGPPGGGGWEFGFTITGPGIPPRAPGTFDSLSDVVFLGASTGAWSSLLAGGLTIIPSSKGGYIGDGI
jgi:hypothetical protein